MARRAGRSIIRLKPQCLRERKEAIEYDRFTEELLQKRKSDASIRSKVIYHTVDGNAAKWFASLPPGSLKDFEDDAQKFISQYSGCLHGSISFV